MYECMYVCVCVCVDIYIYYICIFSSLYCFFLCLSHTHTHTVLWYDLNNVTVSFVGCTYRRFYRSNWHICIKEILCVFVVYRAHSLRCVYVCIIIISQIITTATTINLEVFFFSSFFFFFKKKKAKQKWPQILWCM